MGWRTAVFGVLCLFARLACPWSSTAQEPIPPRFVEPIPIPGNGLGSPTPVPSTAPVPSGPPPSTSTVPVNPVPGAITPAADNLPPPLATPPAPPKIGPLPARSILIEPRTAQGYNSRTFDTAPGEQMAIITGGIKMIATSTLAGQVTLLDAQCDELVIWIKGAKLDDLVNAPTALTGPAPAAAANPQNPDADKKSEIEFYMSGNVILRYGMPTEKRNPDGTPVEEKTMRAERVWYDMNKYKAIAINGDVQFTRPGLRDPGVLKSKEIWQLSQNEYRANQANISSSGLPSDPGLKTAFNQVDIYREDKEIRRNIFGIPFYSRLEDEEVTATNTQFVGRDATVRLLDTPIFYVPYLAGDTSNPLGPLRSLTFRSDSVFGTQVLVTWSILDLLGLTPLPNERWDLNTDYLSYRGPGLGTNYQNHDEKLFGTYMPFDFQFKAYGIYDKGYDKMGNPNQDDFVPTNMRGRVYARGQIELTEQLTFQGQMSYLSDPNFLEAYYKQEYDGSPNQETFAHLKYQEGNGAITFLAQTNFHENWMTETNWWPKVDAYWLGQSFWDRFTYNAWGSAGYANLQPAQVTLNPPITAGQVAASPFPYLPTDQIANAGRFDLMQQISMPFSAGPFKLVPYATVDLAYYTDDLDNESKGRAYGGGGLRASIPFSHLYSDVESELLNLQGLNHKITFNANYYYAQSSLSYLHLPQFDQLNDNAVDQSLREIRPFQTTYYPGLPGYALTYSPVYNPQAYAVRRLLDTNPDTLGSMQVLQLDVDQRWQTKRGYPGMEHTVDWLTLDLSASVFPAKNRDDDSHLVSFLEYDLNWFVGDRTGFTSSGWFDPYDPGVNYWNVGAYFNRTDRTSLYVGYRQFDQVQSKAATVSVSYIFSPKYSIVASSTYDFGLNESVSNSLLLSRTGTDLTISFGLTYNAIVNTFGIQFEIVPNIVANKAGGKGLLSPTPSGLGR